MADRTSLLPILSTSVDLQRPANARWDPALVSDKLDREWDALASETCRFLPAAREICRRHGLPDGGLERFSEGSTPVFAIGDGLVLKIFCPYYHTDYLAELAFLKTVHRSLPVPIPELAAHGDIDGWPYLVMSRLEGRILSDVWTDLSVDDRGSVVEQIGRALACLHAIPVTEGMAPLRVDWRAFLEERSRAAVEQQRRKGVGREWLEQIESFLSENAALLERSSPGVPLHTEPTDSAWLVRPNGDRWILCGLLDFADSMTGDPEYDFPAVGIFITKGDRALFGRFLAAYDHDRKNLDDSLITRLMMLTLLHRYCHLPWFISLSGFESPTPSLRSLAAFWYGC
jgi:hygromycin-B 7''-O-kinase